MSVLQAFRFLPVARETHRAGALPPQVSDYARDAITLGWGERLQARRRRVSDAGLEFGTALPRGTILRAGDGFLLDGPRVVVVVAELEEPVFVIVPASPAEWGLFAYHIGNNHQPMMIADDGIVCADVPGMQQVLEQHGMRFTRAMRPFTPVGLLMDHGHR